MATGVELPRPLGADDVASMRRILRFQSRGAVTDAIRSVSGLNDPLLLGAVLADRYLGRHYRSTFDELSEWLARYGDLPEAARIHALLLTRLPNGIAAPSAPEEAGLNRSASSDPVAEDIDAPRNDLARDADLDRAVLDRAQRDNGATALRLIATTRHIRPAYAAQLRAEVAQVLFTRNDDTGALRVAQAALNGIPPAEQPSLGFYIGGLAAWRQDGIALARSLFEGGANASSTSARLHAASAFWASRASEAMHDAAGMARWMHMAAEERLTLHGLLARRILRMDTGIAPSRASLSQADADVVAGTPQGRRAFAWLQVGQPDRAEAELRALWPKARADTAFGRSLLMVASAAGLTDCAGQMATLLPSEDGQRHDEPRVAVPRLRPAGGFSIDPALVYALTRTESNFDPDAISAAGARGLMQIMPATAQYLSRDLFDAPKRLHEPGLNLAIGQRYVAHLARLDGIDNDLMRILASYNSGPGNFARWGAELRDNGDPLLFMEAIPVAETRDFVPHVLLYSWLYAARLRLPAASLDALAAGEFPRFNGPALAPFGLERTVALLTRR